MRFLFILILLLNVGLFMVGQGLFAQAPSEAGRTARLPTAHNTQLVTLDKAQSVVGPISNKPADNP